MKSTHSPDIVVTDIKMPGMDGLELLRTIKSLDPEKEVIIVTGHGDIDSTITALQCGASDFINKPVRDEALAMGIAAFACIFIGVFPQPLYNLLPFTVEYIPYTGAHVVGQLQLLMFGALAFALLILSGYYPPEIKSINLDVDWTYRKLGTAAYRFLDRGLNTVNRRTEHILMTVVKGGSAFFRQITVHPALFFSVNLWLIQGYRDKHLALKKQRIYNDMVHGTLPIGMGAAVAVSFVILVYVLT